MKWKREYATYLFLAFCLLLLVLSAVVSSADGLTEEEENRIRELNRLNMNDAQIIEETSRSMLNEITELRQSVKKWKARSMSLSLELYQTQNERDEYKADVKKLKLSIRRLKIAVTVTSAGLLILGGIILLLLL